MSFYTLNIVVNVPEDDLEITKLDFLLESIQDTYENVVYTVNLENNGFDCIKCNQKYVLNVMKSHPSHIFDTYEVPIKDENEEIEEHVELLVNIYEQKPDKKSSKKENPEETRRKKYKCSTCEQRFVYKKSLKFHICGKNHQCSACKASFDNETLFHDHFKACKPKKKNFYMCHLCGISFTYKSKLQYHVKHSRTHIPAPDLSKIPEDEQYECHHCAKRFYSKYTIFRHIKRHFPSSRKPKKPVICPTCGATFKEVRNLRHHVRSNHEGKKPYECQLCGKTFTTLSYLKIHLGHHEGQQNYPCKFCELKYRDPGSVAAHMRRFHPIEYEEYKRNKKLKTFE